MRTRTTLVTIASVSAVLLAMFVLLGVMGLTSLSGWTAAARVDQAAVSLQAYTFEGHVYRGQPYDTSTPIDGVTVGLWGDDDEWPEGGTFARVPLANAVTNGAGAFSLDWTPGETFYAYLHVIEEDPPDANSTGAQADDQGAGYVKNFNVVSFYFRSLDPGAYTGIGFWDELPEADTPTPTSTPVCWTFEGRVYEGEVGDESQPLQGVTVSVWGSNNPYPDSGASIGSTTTDADGWYGLLVCDSDGPYEFYHIRETDPSGYTSVGATSVGGTVRTENWIEYEVPLGGKELTGNKFWDRGAETATPTPTSTGEPPTPTPTPTPTATGEPEPEADLGISKQMVVPAQEPVAPGSQIQYNLNVWHYGPDTATNVVVTDVLPPEVAYDSSTGGCTLIAHRPPNDVLRCDLGDLTTFPPGTGILLQVNVDEDACGPIFNAVQVESDTADPNLANNFFELETQVGPCEGAATPTPTATPTPPSDCWTFQGWVYEGEVGDESQPLQGVTVSVWGSNNPYPDSGASIGSTATDASGWYGLLVCDYDGPWEFYHIIETDPLYYISVGATSVDGAVRTENWIEYAIPLEGKTLTGNKFWDRERDAGTPTPTPTTTPTEVLDDVDLEISKTFSLPEPVAAGSYGHYRLRIENHGPSVAYNVVITDELPAEFAFDYGATMCTQVASRPPHDVVRCDLSDVTPGLPVELVIYGTIDADACDLIHNVAEVQSDSPDHNPANNFTELFTQVECAAPTATSTPTATATPTPTPTATATPTPTPTGTVPPDCQGLLTNGDFESGSFEPWGSFGDVDLGAGRDSDYGAWLGGVNDAGGELLQGVSIPADANPVLLEFWWLAESAIEQPDDVIEVIVQWGDEQAEHLRTLRAEEPLGQWRQEVVDLTAYAGLEVAVTFLVHTDGESPTTFRLDDVSVQACSAGTPTPTSTPTSTATATATPTDTYVRTLCPAEDAYVDQANPDSNYGATTDLRVGYGQGVGELFAQRILLRYDLSFIPAGAQVVSAHLELWQTAAGGLGNVLVSAYPISDPAPWHESHVTWNSQPTTSAARAASTYTGLGAPGWASWDVSQLARDWLTGVVDNQGVLLKGPETGGQWHRYYDSAWQQTSVCPKLSLVLHSSDPVPTLTPTPNPTSTPTPTEICPNTDNAGDTFANATAMSVFGYVTGYICPSGDVDYWKFPAANNQYMTIGMGNPPGNPPGVPAPNYDMCLIRPNGATAQCSTNLNPSYGEYLTYDADMSGDWRISVFGKDATDWNKYQTYSVAVDVCNEPDEAGPDFSTADTIKPSYRQANIVNTHTGYICPPNDQDWYKFSLPPTATVTMTAKLINLPANYDLYLYSPSNVARHGSVTSGTANEQLSLTVTNEPGEWRVAVVPNLPTDYSATQAYQLEVDIAGLLRDFSADAWEVTQGIQSLSNDVPLVAKKTTYVRVYGRLLAGQDANVVECRLHGTRGGVKLPGSPLFPVNGTQSLSTSQTYNRAQAGDGWLFKLPSSWVAAGVTSLQAEIDWRKTYLETNLANNTRSGSFTFTARAPVCQMFVPVRTSAPTPSTKSPHFWQMIDLMKRLWPISDVWVYHQSSDVAELETCWWGIIPYPCFGPYELSGDGLLNDDGWKVLLALWNRDNLTDDPDKCDDAGAWTHYVGMVHPDTNTGGTNGMGYLLTAQAWVQFPAASSTPSATTPWTWPGPGATLAHELTHNYDKGHVACDVSSDTDYYPYPVCQLDDATDPTHFGFDVKSQSPIAPTVARDYMAYGDPRWVSDYRYEDMYSEVGGLSSVAARDELAPGVPNLSAAASSVLISGVVADATNQGYLNYAWVYPTEAQSSGIMRKWQRIAAPAYGGASAVMGSRTKTDVVYRLRLLDAGETILDDRIVEPQRDIDGLGQAEEKAFTLTFPAPESRVARIDLLADETVLYSLTPGQSVPEVTILSPQEGQVFADEMQIVWEATDADPEDDLLYTVQYSPDMGQTWRVLTTDFPGPEGSQVVTLTLPSLGSIPGSVEGGLIRVAASDGYNTGLAVSPPFEVTNRPPEPHITSPLAGEPVPAGQTVMLAGGAYDAEDGVVDSDSLSWTVDGEEYGSGTVPAGTALGPLAQGQRARCAEQQVAGLAPGEHALELIAVDSDGQASGTSATLTVDALAVLEGPEPILDGYCDEGAYENAVELQLSPYDDQSQATAHLLRSGRYLYACFSGVAIPAEGVDAYIGLLVDANVSADEVAQSNDYGFFVNADGSSTTRAGDGEGAFDEDGPGGLEAVVTSTEGAWRAELRIDLRVLGGASDTVGLDLAHFWAEGEEIVSRHWPYAAEAGSPATWARTEIGSVSHIVMLPLILKSYPEQADSNRGLQGDAYSQGWIDLPLILKSYP